MSCLSVLGIEEGGQPNTRGDYARKKSGQAKGSNERQAGRKVKQCIVGAEARGNGGRVVERRAAGAAAAAAICARNNNENKRRTARKDYG